MASLLFLNKNQKVIRSFDSADLLECVQKREITTNASELMSDSLSVSVSYFKNIDDARYIAVSNTQKNEFALYYIIKTVEEGGILSFEASNFAINELNAYIIKDIRPQAKDYKTIIPQILKDSGSDWVLGTCEPVNTVTTNFYYTSVREALKALQEVNGEFTFTVEIVNGEITKKKINCYNKIGKVTNTRFEYGSEILNITKQQNRQNIVTSIIGRGKGEEVGDGYGRRLEFTDVVWSKVKGDPLDKPKGQNFLESPEMTKEYGIPTAVGMMARKGVVVFDEIEDDKELLRLTYESLVYYSRPLVEYNTKVLDVEDIGNTITIHWAERDLHYQTRVFKIEADLVNGTVNAGIGDNLSSNQNMPKQLSIINTVAKDAERKSADAVASANGKNTNYYSTSKDGYPQTAKKGDLFFRTYNGETTVYQYDGNEWLVLIDTSWQEDFEKELQDKLDEAKKELDEALEENDKALANLDDRLTENKEALEKNETKLSDLDKQLSDAQKAIDNVEASNEAVVKAVDQAQKDIKSVDEAADKALKEAMKGQSLAETAQGLGQEALDNFKNLSIGGRNLLRNSAFLGKASTGIPDLWIKGGATASSKMISISDLNQINTGVEITQTSLGQSGLRTQKFVENIIGAKSYVQTFWVKNLASDPLTMVIQTGERDKETNAVTYASTSQVVAANSNWVRLSRVVTTKSTTNGIYFYLYTPTKTVTAHYIIAAPEFEEGSVPTDWTPAPEDTQVKIEQLEDGLSTTVSKTEYNSDKDTFNASISRIDQKADSISTTVTNVKKDVDKQATEISKIDQKADSIVSSVAVLDGEVKKQSSDIIQLSNSISLAVQKNDVINQINVSTEGILIEGDNIHISGKTVIDDAIITTAMIKELDASVITTGTLAANLIVPTSGNMLMNSEFQSNTFFDGWTLGGSLPVKFYDSMGYYEDEYAGRSYCAGIASQDSEATTAQWGRLYQDVRARENQVYSFSAILRVDVANIDSTGNAGRMGINVQFMDVNNQSLASKSSYLPMTPLKVYSTVKLENQTAPSGTKYIRFHIFAAGKVNGYATRAMMNRGAKVLPYTASTGQVIVGSDMIVDGAVIAKHLAANSVTANAIAANSITAVKIAANSITADKILAGAITTKHLAAGSITATQLAAGAVNMGSATVTGTLDASKIKVINLDASELKAGTINAATVRIINLDASAISTGSLNASRIAAGSITADKLAANAIQVGLGQWNSTVRITPYQIAFYSGTKQTSYINDQGFNLIRDGVNIGHIGANSMKGDASVRGLDFDLEYGAQYMTWAHMDTSGASTYTTKLVWSNATRTNINMKKGFSFSDNVYLNEGINMSGNTTKVKFNGTSFNGNNYPVIASTTGAAAVAFGSSILYLINDSKYFSVTRLQKFSALSGGLAIATGFNSDGTAKGWYNI